MRDQGYWERWIRRNGPKLKDRLAGIKEWFKEAGVEKGERRAFRAAFKSVDLEGLPWKKAKTPRRGKGKQPLSVETAGDFRDGRRGTGDGRALDGRLRFNREGRPFVVPEDPDMPIVRIPGHSLSGAWPRDRVRVRL
ncbi:MAG: hypothetical protein FWH25_01230, partial [Syntrophorhabdaceae bacterium]|nr:hypothetical protein [Syntrophorhabdaceae bacterium]